ncbi:MAG: hypothetical protein ACRD41_06550, partial [Candidatus Acidiferrales bacterium]
MTQKYCQVALPVPLRSVFTYAVPESLQEEELIGRRVVVPFRNRPMVGVVLEVGSRAPAGVKRVKEIASLVDPIPALTPQLIELGNWISRYYLAPVGEAFRSILPPEIELRHDREYRLTDAGRAYLLELCATEEKTDTESAEYTLLKFISDEEEGVNSARLARFRGGESLAEALVRRECLSAREVLRSRKTRQQKIVAWNAANEHALENSAEEKIREVLTATRGPLPLKVLTAQVKATPTTLARLEKRGHLLIWEEPLTSEEDAWETDFTPPVNVLNPEQNLALQEIWRWLLAGKFEAALLHGVTG